MDEFEIIAEVFAPLATSPFAFGLKDDAAAIPSRTGFDLVVSTDTLTEGVDFFAGDPAQSVARKALRVNLSDLAAKGAEPFGYLLALTLPAQTGIEWIRAFAHGLAHDQAVFDLSLLGGDTGQGSLTITITAMGFVPANRMIRRSGARAGDDVYVTGTIGDSGGGLAILKHEPHRLDDTARDVLVKRYHVPEPPVAFGPALLGLASASVDVSDGLMADLGHVARASGVRLVIDAAAIPRSQGLRALWGEGAAAIRRAATAGDDYQIAFTADPARAPLIMAEAARTGTLATRIGRVEAGEGTALLLDGEPVMAAQSGYRHFRN